MNALANPAFTIEQFEGGDVDPDRFDHQAHIFNDSKTLLARHYSNETLLSDNARERFVLPDNIARF